MSTTTITAPPDTARDEDELAPAAHQIAAQLAADAATRDRAGQAPLEELARLRSTGLLAALEPREVGGGGLTFEAGMRLTRIVARGDTSIGQLLGYHYVNGRVPTLFGTHEQAASISAGAAKHGWFVGAVDNPLDPELVMTADGDGFKLNGRKTFATGARVADRIIVGAHLDGPRIAYLPADRQGIVANADWDNMGQRLTESGSVELTDVRVERGEILGAEGPGAEASPWASLLTPMAQLSFVNIYLGAAEGAIADAIPYTRSTSRPWFLSGVDRAARDPYVLERYGTMIASVQAAVALADVCGTVVQRALEQGPSLSPAERAEVAVRVAAAKVNATEVALAVTARVFEVMGARATASRYGFDRRWRDVRTHTLHDPVAYKAREVGAYFVDDVAPEFTLYT